MADGLQPQAAKRERLKELQRAGQQPKLKRVREPDVVAAIGKLRDLLLDRHASAASNDAPKEMWAAVDDAAQPAETKRAAAGAKGDTIVSLAYDRKAAARKAARNRDGAS